MKFRDISLKHSSAEDIFLGLLQKHIDYSFGIVEKDISRNRHKQQELKIVKYNAVKDSRIIELSLWLKTGYISHLTLHRLNVRTFYGVHFKLAPKITLRTLDTFVPVLKQFIDRGIVDESVFYKNTGEKKDDWPAEIIQPKPVVRHPKRALYEA